MANNEHLDILKQGVMVWNRWRKDNPKIIPDLRGANFQGAEFLKIKTLEETFRKAQTLEAKNFGAKIEAQIMGGAPATVDRQGVDIRRVDFTGAKLRTVDLEGANLRKAQLLGTGFSGANLSQSSLIRTILDKADLSNCRIYGISAWDISLEKTIQSDLIITWYDQPIITLDNLEVAQFIYLLLNNEKIRHVIDTITSKVVLILGRFTPERKTVLDAIREELRKSDYLPVLFDFDKPDSRDFIETVSTLAHMARFVIADFTDAKIVLEEVPHIVRNIKVPVIPLLLEGSGDEPVTLYNLRRGITYLLDTYWYKDTEPIGIKTLTICLHLFKRKLLFRLKKNQEN